MTRKPKTPKAAPQAETLAVSEAAQLRALSSELRQELLAAFCSTPKTTKQVAVELALSPTKLYHHVEILEKADLLRLVEVRPKRGTTEKYFQAVARRFEIGSRALGKEPEKLERVFTDAFQQATEALRSSLARDDVEEGVPLAMLARGTAKLTPEQFKELQDRIEALINEYAHPSNGAAYHLLAAIVRKS